LKLLLLQSALPHLHSSTSEEHAGNNNIISQQFYSGC